MSTRRDSTSSGSGDEGGFGLGELMPRSPSPEPIPFSYASYDLPESLGYTAADGGREVSIRLVGSHPLWGHHLWNTARVTTTYLLTHAPTLLRGKRVLELGAGGALPSVAAALAGAECVVATDYADAALMENIDVNFERNLPSAVRGNALAVGHTWGHDVAPLLAAGAAGSSAADGRYDLVILSDLMFNHSQHDALIKTLDATLSLAKGVPTAEGAAPQTPCALVFLTHHRPRLADADMAFFPRLAASGSWGYERVVEEWTGPMFDNDPGDERVRGTVHGFRCWRL
ncbi:Protein N-terminal and lysine N-methyltransferase EFM7 [Vanrija pseudolonga]|uniref:Protein N-terminal and lysine N-methyltransferase EFM7 n=1 Tax=Vanrija pseudolonga TaxID=143232 RepID=A0AAF1BET3_9TREE|nr:Protein N-terminal and lysine N-methyltransferase EFM7 [Vanrija pseudolonga]